MTNHLDQSNGLHATKTPEKPPSSESQQLSSDNSPFATITWQQWQDLETQIDHCLQNFLQAAKEKQTPRIHLLGLEILEIASKLLLEATILSSQDHLHLEPVPKG